MKSKIFSLLFLLAFSAILWLTNPGKVYAAAISITGKAKVLNTNNSYLDFTNYNSNVTINNSSGVFSGYAFLEDVGWVAFGSTDNTDGPVSLDLITGVVSGKAKVLNTGAFLNFTSYNSNVVSTIPGGVFSGYVFSEDVGWINFGDIGVSSNSSFENIAPSLSLTALSPDPNTDTTPTISGTATEAVGTVTAVQFQMDSTSGSWSSCTADDGTFDEATEIFTCTSSALSDGSHTMYVRATDSNSNTTASGSESSDAFTIDATAPTNINLESPGDNSHTNSERPSFKWKATTDATAGLSKYVLEIDNPTAGSGQVSADFTIDNIPTSGTEDVASNKYIIHFDGFSDSDSSNNYISVYTRSHTDWGNSENNGKLREGKVNWKVKARDSVGNETSSSRTLFVDRTSPKVEITQVNDILFTSEVYNTTDKSPTIFGKITDLLSGGNSSQNQNDDGPKIVSGPRTVEVKLEKKDGLFYKLHTLYTINLDKPKYTCDDTEVNDNSKQRCDKYLPFQYTPETNLDLGTYKITLKGKDKADNSSSGTSFTLNITTLDQITTSQEKEIIKEELKDVSQKEQEEVKKELEITKSIETPKPNAIQQTGGTLTRTGKNIIGSIGNFITTLFTGIANGIKTAFRIVGDTIAFIFNKTGRGLAYIGNAYNFLAQNSPKAVKSVMLAVGNGFTGTTAAVKNGIANLVFTIGVKTQDISHGVGTAIIKLGYFFVPGATKIYDVKVIVISPTSAKVSWKTNHPANGKVNYGLDETYPFDVQTDKRTNNHEFTLTNLSPDTEYYFEVMSQNRNYVYDANRKFKTLPAN